MVNYVNPIAKNDLFLIVLSEYQHAGVTNFFMDRTTVKCGSFFLKKLLPFSLIFERVCPLSLRKMIHLSDSDFCDCCFISTNINQRISGSPSSGLL